MKKTEINVKTAVTSIITCFVAYAIFIIFAGLLIIAAIKYFLGSLQLNNLNGLYITLPLIFCFFIYFISHLICRLSTYDVFKNCKTSTNNYKSIVHYLNAFFVICIIFSIVLFLSLLYLNIKYQRLTIDFIDKQNQLIFSEEFTKIQKNEMEEAFSISKTNLITATAILEIGLSISLLSLIPYQRKMIVRYNDISQETTTT